MPMSEEERRRCILLGGCSESARVNALAEVIEEIRGQDQTHEAAVVIARGLLARGYVGRGLGHEQGAALPEESAAG